MLKKILILTLITISLSINLRFADEKPNDQKDKVNGWERIELLSKAAQNIAGGWKEIVSAFKTTSSKKISKFTEGKGFEYFYGHFRIWLCKGLKAGYYDEFFKRKAIHVGVPQHEANIFKEAVQDAKFMEGHAWGDLNIVFNPAGQQDGKVIGVNVIINQPGDKFNIMITSMNARLKLAPDVFVEETSKSVAGGIFEKTNYKLIKMPRGLTIDDVKAVLNMYQLISFKMICEIFGIQVQLPQI